MSLRKIVEEVKHQMDSLEGAKAALKNLSAFGIETSITNIDLEHSIAEDNGEPLHLDIAIQEAVKDLKLYISEEEGLIAGGDVEDITPFFDEDKKTAVLYFHTEDARDWEDGFLRVLEKMDSDYLKHVSKTFFMFLGDINVMQASTVGERVLLVLPEEVDMTVGIFQEMDGDKVGVDLCENPDFPDTIYAEVVCLMK